MKNKHSTRRHRRATRKHMVVGAPPGTLTSHVERDAPPIHVLTYGDDTFEEFQVSSAAELRELRGAQAVTWVHVEAEPDTDTLQTIGEVFGLHHLALEDVMHLGQRPKAEDYDETLFIVLQVPQVADSLCLQQVSLFLGNDFVVTFQERPGPELEPVRERVRQARGRIRKGGPDYLAYAIVDAIVDTYFPTLERYGVLLDGLENQLITTVNGASNLEIHSIRQELGSLRRPLWAMRETLGHLSRNDDEHFAHETQIFLRDCLDHTSQLMDIVESCREMGASLMDFHLSNMSHRMNEVMKVLTIIATLFIPLSFIAGLYGMNFDRSSAWNMPELGWTYGYPFALGLMFVTVVGLLVYLRRKGWLGSANDNPPRE